MTIVNCEFQPFVRIMSEKIVCTIPQGKLQGTHETDIDGTPFFGFMGIPYAKDPLGKLRFMPPQPPEKWEEIRDASKEGNICYQKPLLRDSKGSEDCLYLNVYTRGLNGLRPVMVFIHGGAFLVGTCRRSEFGPEFLMTEDIVLVTINYRVGTLGFLTVEDPELGATGNAGLKDQIQALKWVQENIRYFGGDSSNVTIFGHSAGGSSAHYLLLSPLAQGLFHKGILQSGSSLCPWASGDNNSAKLAQELGCKKTGSKEILEFLQNVAIDKLLAAQHKMTIYNCCPSDKKLFAPTVEPQTEDALLCEEPLKLMVSGQYNHVPIMMGYTSMEGIMETFGEKFGLQPNFEKFVPYNFGFTDSKKYEEMNKKIIRFYFGKDSPNSNDKVALAKLFSDVLLIKAVYTTAKVHAKTGQKPVYLYRVSLESDLNRFKKMAEAKIEGVCHGDELGYLFKSENVKLEKGSIEELGVHRFVKMWANFARCGNPIPEKTALLNADWSPIGKKLHFLDIGTDLVAGTDPDKERMQFWEEITPGIAKL